MIQSDITLVPMTEDDVIEAIKKIGTDLPSADLLCDIWNVDFSPESWDPEIEAKEAVWVNKNAVYDARHTWSIYNRNLPYFQDKSEKWKANHKKLSKNEVIPFLTVVGQEIKLSASKTVYNYFTVDIINTILERYRELSKTHKIYSIHTQRKY